MADGSRVDADGGVAEWEAGLPSLHELASLSLSLVPPDLASAFRISPEPPRTASDVNRASQSTLLSLRDARPFGVLVEDCEVDELVPEEGSDLKRSRLMDPVDEEPGGNWMDGQSMEVAEKASKKPRLVWTPQLHKRFVEVVAHLGLKNAVPKTIMQLMNVEGLSRENVASHLQKYRLYVKRMQGLSDEVPSQSDCLFASSDATFRGGGPIHGNDKRVQNSGENGNHEKSNGSMPIQMPYTVPPHFMPVPIMAMAAENVNSGYHEMQQQQQQHNNMLAQQQREWPGNMYNIYPYHVANLNK